MHAHVFGLLGELIAGVLVGLERFARGGEQLATLGGSGFAHAVIALDHLQLGRWNGGKKCRP